MHTNAMATDTKRVETPLSRLIREQGRLKGWVADQLGIGPERLSRLISGERRLTLEEGIKLADLFGVPIETLLPASENGGAP